MGMVWRGDMIAAIPRYITRLSVIIASLVYCDSCLQALKIRRGGANSTLDLNTGKGALVFRLPW